jgi:hypothetical protein
MKREFLVERQGRSFVLYAGLLDEAHGQGLKSIRTQLVQIPNPENGNVAICTAEVTTDRGVYCGVGDASPDNVSRTMLPHIIRMAETRAKARALRDAVNVGVTALEELGEIEENEAADAPRPTQRPAEATRADDAPRPRHAPSGPTLTPPAGMAPRPAATTTPAATTNGYANGFAPSGSAGHAATATLAHPTVEVGLATQPQVRAIYGIGRKEFGLSEAQVDEKSVSLYGVPPAELSRKQASDFITSLKGGDR